MRLELLAQTEAPHTLSLLHLVTVRTTQTTTSTLPYNYHSLQTLYLSLSRTEHKVSLTLEEEEENREKERVSRHGRSIAACLPWNRSLTLFLLFQPQQQPPSPSPFKPCFRCSNRSQTCSSDNRQRFVVEVSAYQTCQRCLPGN